MQISMLNMGVSWRAHQTEQSLRESTIHVYFTCLQDVWPKHVIHYIFGGGGKKHISRKKIYQVSKNTIGYL